ncbi:hypothetical protein DOTSEDRAFT_148087 [Dothistroma septosporum NZE10]|uniref:UBC core domain-containing protein n=1 Tax=Dothistroma septosporum (strain NZE10 / CBS 128990) TaxID=675120 RepID=N1PUQ3_DOTSN|nr:hypothetical protein DOTSEDRAFT_148087 [Dothistroma septosporum NZE10]
MPLQSAAFVRQKLCVDFASLKHACPKGIYVAPVPDEPLIWKGVLFVRKGPYANAVLRFQINFPDDYPQRPPVVTFQSDLFHPLVTPLTTYTHSTISTDTQSAVDEQRLPPGGLSLRHGFPEWLGAADEVAIETGVAQPQTRQAEHDGEQGQHTDATVKDQRAPHIVELLHYVRIVFDTQEMLDAVPLNAAANTGAWHAWRSFRTKAPAGSRGASVARSLGDGMATSIERSVSPRQQPGGARRPGEWNWQGVWEERVRRSVQTTLSEPVLFGGDSDDVISFLKMDQQAVSQISPMKQAAAATAV